MKIQELRALPSNYGGLRGVTRYIVIHYTGNANDTARANANYFANNRVGASAHYFVDDNEIYSSVPEGYIAWHCETRGMSFKCACRNNNSIGIELCTCGNYQISDKTAERAAELVKSLMEKYDVPVDRVIRHYDVCGKRCPAPWVDDVNKWLAFKEMLQDMTETKVQQICNDMIYKYLKELKDELIIFINNKLERDREPVYNTLADVPEWARDTIGDWIEKGYIKGDGKSLNLGYNITRLIVMLERRLQQ